MELSRPRENALPPKEREEELPMISSIKDSIIDTLKSINVDTITPIEALSKLYELSREAKDL